MFAVSNGTSELNEVKSAWNQSLVLLADRSSMFMISLNLSIPLDKKAERSAMAQHVD